MTKKDLSDSRKLTARDMISPLFRNWRAVLISFWAIFAITIAVAWHWSDHYYATSMQVVVSRERSDPPISGQQQSELVDDNSTITADQVASEIALLQGRDMLEKIVQTCDLTKQYPSVLTFWRNSNARDPGATDPNALQTATNLLGAQLHVEAEKFSDVIDVSYGHRGVPETPACVLQTLGKLYLAKHVRLERPAGSFDFFAEETDKYREALSDSERRLADFSQSEGIGAPEVIRADTAQQLVAAQSNLYQARQEIVADQQRLENLKKQMGRIPPRSFTAETSIAANTLLDQLKSSLLAAQTKKTQLLMKFDPSYPLVKEIDEEIEQTKQAIAEAEQEKYMNTTTDRDPTYEYLRQDEAKTEADLASEQATAKELGNTIRGMQSEIVKLDVEAVQQGALLRETKANEANYLLYLTKREQERTSDALDQRRIANVAIAVPAEVPALPARNPFSVVFPGFFLALFGGIGTGYLAELTDSSFRTPAEVEEILNIPMLAAIPKQSR